MIHRSLNQKNVNHNILNPEDRLRNMRIVLFSVTLRHIVGVSRDSRVNTNKSWIVVDPQCRNGSVPTPQHPIGQSDLLDRIVCGMNRWTIPPQGTTEGGSRPQRNTYRGGSYSGHGPPESHSGEDRTRRFESGSHAGDSSDPCHKKYKEPMRTSRTSQPQPHLINDDEISPLPFIVPDTGEGTSLSPEP